MEHTVAINRKKSGGEVMAAQEKGNMTVREAGRKGGVIVRDRYGPNFYHTIGKSGGLKGGHVVKKKYGPKFYKEIGAKGGRAVKRLIEQGHIVQREGNQSLF